MRLFLIAAITAVVLGNVGCQMSQHEYALKNIAPELETLELTPGERVNLHAYNKHLSERALQSDLDVVLMKDKPTGLPSRPLPLR